jgi:hypothetical protein
MVPGIQAHLPFTALPGRGFTQLVADKTPN